MPRLPYSIAAFWPAGLLVLLAPSCGGGGGGSGGGNGGGGGGGDPIDPGLVPDLGASEFRVTPAFGTPADGSASVAIELRLISSLGRPIQGAVVELEISGCGNRWLPLPPSGPDGRTRGTLASVAGEKKTLLASTTSGGRRTEFEPRTTEFLLIPDDTFFVRVSGSDTNSGRAPREAWRTLGHALANLGPGATLHIGAGVYSEALRLEVDSSGTSPLVLSGDRSGVQSGDAGEVVIDAGGRASGLLVSSSRNVLVRGLTLRGGAHGLAFEGASQIHVEDCRLQENDLGLIAQNVQDLCVQDCRISANRVEGLRLENTLRARIENNLIYANGGEGLVLGTQSAATLVRFNSFYRNARSHLREEGPGGAGSIAENILAEGGDAALELSSGTAFQTSTNLVWANFRPGPTRETPDGSIEADPMFADPCGPDGILGGVGAADDDFRLQPTSAAIDRGTQPARDVVLGSRESLGARSSRVDGVIDGSDGDLPAANLGFHPPTGEERMRSVEKGGGRIVQAVADDHRARFAAWERTHPTLSEPLPGPTLEADVVHLEQRLSPNETREELVAAQIDTGTHGRILVRHWDGRRWGERASSPFIDDIPRSETVDRRFDLEFEGLSGRALFVAAGGDGIPRYRILQRGTWSLERSVSESPAGAGRVRLVELVARAGTDELALVTLDDQRDLVVTLWDGSSFGPPRLLESNTVFGPSWRPFDAAFESLSGDVLVSWGFSTFAEETRWATFERATGQWRTGQHPSTDAIGAQVVLAPDPTSDRIAATMGEASFDNDVIVSMWDGAQWVHTAELTLAGPIASRLHEVVWLGRSGVACTVFRRQGHTGSFNVAFFLPTGWRIQPDVVLAGVGKAAKVRLVSAPDRSGLLGAVLDLQGRLFGLGFDGQSFSLLDAGQPLATGLEPLAPGFPFDVVLAAPVPVR